MYKKSENIGTWLFEININKVKILMPPGLLTWVTRVAHFDLELSSSYQMMT